MAGYRVGTECIPCFNCTHPPAFSPVEPIFKLQLHQLPGNLPKALRTHNAFVLSGSTRYSKDTSTEKCRKSCKTCKSHFSKRQQDNNNLKTTTTRLFLSTWEWNPWCPEVFSLKTSVHVLNADPLSSLPAPAYCTIVASPSFILATPLCSVGFVLWQRFSQLQYPPRCAKCMLGMQTPCFIILWESNPSSRRCT